MIFIGSIRDIKNKQFDEVWSITNSDRLSKSPGIKHVKELAPSWDLYNKTQNLKKQGQWCRQVFDMIYVPQFLKEMNRPYSRDLLNKLYKLDKQNKNIALVCFCSEEETCHRAIIAGLLQGVGCNVEGVHKDYSHYYNEYLQIKYTKTKEI